MFPYSPSDLFNSARATLSSSSLSKPGSYGADLEGAGAPDDKGAALLEQYGGLSAGSSAASALEDAQRLTGDVEFGHVASTITLASR